MKRRLHHTWLAESDLVGIWRYTRELWDERQADKYLLELEEGIQGLTEAPDMGVGREEVRAGYRVLVIKRHAVYYKVTATEIRIVRVLHGQMDPRRHL